MNYGETGFFFGCMLECDEEVGVSSEQVVGHLNRYLDDIGFRVTQQRVIMYAADEEVCAHRVAP